VTLTDAGPLIALINRNDPNHVRCTDALLQLPSGPMLSTWPAFTEAMHLLLRAGGYPAQQELWRMIRDARVVLRDLTETEISRSDELMNKYQDLPMDLADASLVATAETLSLRKVFALDNDFRVYRLADGSTLEQIP
jgi:predicted nucleic acid-binding protein